MIILTDKMLVIPVGISPNYSSENKPSLEDKSVEITANGDYSYTANPDYDGIGNFNVKVNVQWPVESEKTVNPSFNEDITVLPSEGFDAMSSVIVKKAEANLQDKTVDKASTSQIVLTADEGYQGLGTVTVAPIKTTSVTADPSTNVQEFSANTENNEYITSVTVNPVNTRSINVDPSTNSQVVNAPENEYITSVTVNPVGTKTVTVDSSTNAQTVNANVEGNEYITSVTVNPVKTKSLSITPRLVEQTFTAEQELYKTVNVSAVKYTEKTYDASTNTQTYDYTQNDYTFIKNLTINPVTSNIDPNIVPEYIAKGVSILGVTGNLEAGSITPTEAYAIRPTSGRLICPLTNVLLNETSWVSLDFAMDTSSLSKEKACLFGISASSLYCYLNNGVLHMYTGEEVPFNKQIRLDTNRHTLEFGFVSKADESGHAEFEVVFDGEMVADVMVLVPTFNLPLSLFDIALSYNESYESYLNNGGITHIVNGTGYGVGDSVFDLFSLTVYDKPGYYRQTINAYTPSLDANNKPIFIDNITGEYQYPASGTYSYVKIDGYKRTEIASATYTMPFSNDFQYFRPSEGAIVPTDIELPALHRITMYVKDIDSFDGGTSQDALENVKNRVMIGAQPNIIAPFNHIDYEKGLPRLPINNENTAILGDTSVGLFNSSFEVYSGYTYSINGEDAYRSVSQAFPSLKGEHTIKFGQRAYDINNVFTFFLLDNNEQLAYSIRGFIPPDVITRINENKMTPLCIFGTYNFVEGTKPDYVNSLGYENALNELGYTTGVRYAVKQIDIEEYPIGTQGKEDLTDNEIRTLRHRLVTHTDNNGVNCLFDTITGTSYYPYNGTLDVYTPPVEPEPTPAPTILTDTYIKPSEGAIVPTDIKFTSLTLVGMRVKGFDRVDAEYYLDSRAMIGAQPNFIVSPFTTFADGANSKIGIYFKGCGNVLNSTDNDAQLTFIKSSECSITVGYRPIDLNNFNIDTDTEMSKVISIGQKSTYKKVGPTSTPIYKFVDDQMTTPICIFGNYNNPKSMTPDDVIALGYENALNELGYTTGVRYGVKRIDIAVRNADGSRTITHTLVPARDKDGIICLYDTITEKSYYPFHGTLDII